MTKQAPNKMRAWRREHGLTQADAADMFGASRQQWWRWEKGSELPGPGYLIELHREGVASPNDFYDLPAWASGRQMRREVA